MYLNRLFVVTAIQLFSVAAALAQPAANAAAPRPPPTSRPRPVRPRRRRSTATCSAIPRGRRPRRSRPSGRSSPTKGSRRRSAPKSASSSRPTRCTSAPCCYDSDPSGIIVSDARRDAPLDDTDSFQMIIDTYRDRQNGFVFGTNPAGIEYDGQVTNEGQGGGGLGFGQMQSGGSGAGFNINWDGAVDGALEDRRARLVRRVRHSVPHAALSVGHGADLGHQFPAQHPPRVTSAPTGRRFRGSSISTGCRSPDRSAACRRRRCATSASRRTGSATLLASGEVPVDAETDFDFGGDLKYSITPSLTLDATVNTDFAQVEVDDQQVNLDRFTLFFPEKRPFFLENAGFFSVGNPGEVDLFFSRRIGIGDNGAGDSDHGRRPRLGQGRQVQRRPAEHADVRLRRHRSPSTNFSVARVSRDLPNRSSIGGIFTNRVATGDLAADDDHGRTYGVDGKIGIGMTTMRVGLRREDRDARRGRRAITRSTCARRPTGRSGTSTSATRRSAADSIRRSVSSAAAATASRTRA